MTQEELYALLSSAGIPFAFHVWRSPPKLPWGIYQVDGDDVFFADGVPYFSQTQYTVLLYTEIKDPIQEEKLERVFFDANIRFQKTETAIESEKLYEVRYEIEV